MLPVATRRVFGPVLRIAPALLLIAACESGGDPLDSQGPTTNNPVTNVTSNGPTTNASATNSSATSGDDPTGGTGGMTDGSATDTGGPAPTQEICDKYLACIAVVTPEALPGAQMGFGPDGTCWDGPPESIQQCIDACVAGLEMLRPSNLDVPACVDCIDPSDCADGLNCFEGQCVDSFCGDGTVDADEICDDLDDPYCDECVHDHIECNPFSHAGCAAGERCIAAPQQGTYCTPEDTPGPSDGMACEYFAAEVCAPGLACALETLIPGCPEEGCCTLLCNLQEPDTCPNGRTCQNEFPANYIGICLP